MASCVWNIRTKNYQNPIIGFKVTVKNVGDVFEPIQGSKIQRVCHEHLEFAVAQSTLTCQSSFVSWPDY